MEDEYKGPFDTALDELHQVYEAVIKAIFDTSAGRVLGRFFDYIIGKLGRWSDGL